MTGKERAQLRKLANSIDATVQIGKNGIAEQVLNQIQETILARELVKVRVLETAPLSSREAAARVAQALGAETIQVIGSKFVIYKKNLNKRAGNKI